MIFCAHGQLGASLLKSFEQADPAATLKTLSWKEVGHLNAPQLREKIAQTGAIEGPCDFILANGLTDPKISPDLLMASNLRFPQMAVEAMSGHPGCRFVTFGTIFENFPEACKTNPYMRSKLDLSQWILSHSNSDRQFIHFRLHTLYGGKAAPHLFLGQMIEAIRSNSEFKMTRGDQIREYHHVDDISYAVVKFLDRQSPSSVIELNSGIPLPLHEIATTIFEAFGKTPLLKVGAIEVPEGENKTQTFLKSDKSLLPRSREPLQNIILWLRNNLTSTNISG